MKKKTQVKNKENETIYGLVAKKTCNGILLNVFTVVTKKNVVE